MSTALRPRSTIGELTEIKTESDVVNERTTHFDAFNACVRRPCCCASTAIPATVANSSKALTSPVKLSGVTSCSGPSFANLERISNDCLDASECEMVDLRSAKITFHSVCERTMSGCCCRIKERPATTCSATELATVGGSLASKSKARYT